MINSLGMLQAGMFQSDAASYVTGAILALDGGGTA